MPDHVATTQLDEGILRITMAVPEGRLSAKVTKGPGSSREVGDGFRA